MTGRGEPPRRDRIYWLGVVLLAAHVAYTLRIGWAAGSAIGAFVLGVVLAVPVAWTGGFDQARRTRTTRK